MLWHAVLGELRGRAKLSGFDAEIQTLRRASEAAHSAGEQAQVVDLPTAIRGLVVALPGSMTARSANALANNWSGQLSSWSRTMVGYGEKLSAAADAYTGNEDAVARDFVVIESSGGARPV